MKLSNLIDELTEKKLELSKAQHAMETAREEFLDNGGYSWGYYGGRYFDVIDEKQAEVDRIKAAIDVFMSESLPPQKGEA